jgi:hypothetical protein
MKNLAGNDVSIFLFRFVLRKNSISYVVNESIAEDMYPEIDKQIQPLAHACCATLLRYKDLCSQETIMDGNILTDGYFEVMLKKGLGIHFIDLEKQNLFNDAHKIAELLIKVMDKRSEEERLGTYPGPQKVISSIDRISAPTKGLEALVQTKRLHEMPFLVNDGQDNIKRLLPDDLPREVIANLGYDHRGHCVTYTHATLEYIGKIVAIDAGENISLIVPELFLGNPETLDERKDILQEIFNIVENVLNSITSK